MRALIVTFGIPSTKYGGGIGIIQSLKSVSAFESVDYVGPEFSETELLDLTFENKYYLSYENNPFNVAISFLFGLPIRFYKSWKKISKQLARNNYDIVYTDFSRYDFVTNWAHRNGFKSIVRVHNIEYDYVDRANKKMKNSFRKLISAINVKSVKRRENACLVECDMALFLNNEDAKRAMSLYGKYAIEKHKIVPVCVEKSIIPRNLGNKELPEHYILATGSLWYGPNSEGIIWFIENVWKHILNGMEEFYFVIAGGNPTVELKQKCNEIDKCILLENPENMMPLFEFCDIYVAPIFDGAGMKVKIAEALSYSLPIVGTSHAFLGYKTVENLCMIADDPEDFRNCILHICDMLPLGDENKYEIEKIFSENYSINSSKKLISEACLEIVKKDFQK